MFRFEHVDLLWALGIIPLMLLAFFLMMRKKTKLLKSIGDIKLIRSMIPEASKGKLIFKLTLFLFGILFLTFGMANLQTGSKLQEVKREGADLMICLDVSNSMLAEDLQPNRLVRAKLAIEKLIDELDGDRIGLVVFAGDAYVQLPITTDYGSAKLFLNGINPGMMPSQGTNITSAIETSMESFGQDLGKNKAIIIITDGETHEDEAKEAAKEASKSNVTIHTIGIGSLDGVPIPVYKNGVPSGYRTDKEGNTVITKLNADLLKIIAGNANGIYVQASNSDLGLNLVLSKIRELDKKQIESKMYTDFEDQFQWFIAAALLFLSLEIFFTERKSKFWQKIKPV